MATMLNIEPRLEIDANNLCQKLGVTIADVFNAFLRNMVSTGALPTEVKRELTLDEVAQRLDDNITYLQQQSERNGNSEMTLDEINAIIYEVRNERRRNV